MTGDAPPLALQLRVVAFRVLKQTFSKRAREARVSRFDERSIRTYLEARCGGPARILAMSPLGQEPGAGDLKGYGYGVPVKVEYEVSGRRQSAVLETVTPGPFEIGRASCRERV